MSKKSILIFGIVLIVIAVVFSILYKYKPEIFATTLSTTGIIELSTRPTGVAIYWKYPGISNYVYVKTTDAYVIKPVQLKCKRGLKYSMLLKKTGYRNYTYIANCPQKNGTINLRPN